MKKELIFLFVLIFLTGFVVAAQGNTANVGEEFCGSSTNAPCSSNSDCKMGGCSGQICGSVNDSAMTTCEYTECYNAASYGLTCGCSENKCKWISSNIFKCAKEGEKFSKVYPEYPENCCEGLTEWDSGMDTRKVMNGTCVKTNLKSGWPVGTCLNCGNGVCESIENVCNCPEDCKNTIITTRINESNITTTTIIEESNTTIYECPDYVLPFCEHELTGIKDKNGCQMFICKKRLAITIQNQSECPENCTCSGSTVKCMINGQREMTVTAGKSGNVIVQIKGENMSTNVTLYKANEKVYGAFKNNKTKEVKMMPDQVAEKIKKRLQQREEKYNITLDENGIYHVQTKKKAKLFYLFPVREKTQLELSSESGEIIKVRNPWWGFLAKDTKEQPLVGSSCGTVTPGYNEECCQNKGYDVWNATSSDCEFTESN